MQPSNGRSSSHRAYAFLILFLVVKFPWTVTPSSITTSPDLGIGSVILIVWTVSRNMAKLLTDETWAICSPHRSSLVWRSKLILGSDKRSHWEIYRHRRNFFLLRLLQDSRVTTKALPNDSICFLLIFGRHPFLPPDLSFSLCRAMLWPPCPKFSSR